MLRYTEEMVCCRCGRHFRHMFNDTITPRDIEFRRHPLCNRCRKLTAASDILHGKRKGPGGSQR